MRLQQLSCTVSHEPPTPYAPPACHHLLNPVQEVRDLFTTSRLCWEHLIVRDNRADNDGSISRGLITHLLALGMKEIWQQYGTGEKRRMLPLHQAVSNLGAPLAKTVIKEQMLTGDDCMSKVGTKHAAMASDPVQYLTNVGEVDTLSDQDTALAEKYLVRVWAGGQVKYNY